MKVQQNPESSHTYGKKRLYVKSGKSAHLIYFQTFVMFFDILLINHHLKYCETDHEKKSIAENNFIFRKSFKKYKKTVHKVIFSITELKIVYGQV